jgi:hypothetical protein
MARAKAIYHIQRPRGRTTVSLDKLLSELLALSLGKQPDTPEAHLAVRHYLQEKLDTSRDPHRIWVSQWLRDQVFLDLVDKNLSRKYWKWFDESLKKK